MRGFSSSGMRMEFRLSQSSRMKCRLSRMREFLFQLIRGVHEPRRLVKDGVHEFKSQLEQDLLRIHMFGMMAGSQHGELQGLERMPDHTLGNFEGIAASPFRFHQMKTDLMPFRWCICPGPQTTTAHKFICFFFKKGPVLDAVSLLARHFSSYLFSHFFIAERSAEKRHDVGIAPKTSR